MATDAAASLIGFLTGVGLLGSLLYRILEPGAAKKAAKRANELAVKRNTQALSTIEGFGPDFLFAGGSEEGGIALDVAGGRFATSHPGKHSSIHSFDDLVSVQLERDGETIHQTDRGSQAAGAAIGGALLGGIGFLVGGLTGASRTTKRISKLSLKFYMTDVRTPVVEVVFFQRPKAVAPDDAEVKSRAREMEEWYARFQAVLHGRQRQSQLRPDAMALDVPR